MKSIALLSALLCAVSSLAVAGNTTPQGHKLGMVQDEGWLKGATPFELHRDFKAAPLPPIIDDSDDMEPWQDQSDEGSCTGWGCRRVFAAAVHRATGMFDTFSAQFIYYNERVIEHTVNEDAGAQIRDGIQALITYGVCHEKLWPYRTDNFRVKPAATAYREATAHQVIKAYKVNNDHDSLCKALSLHLPVVYGMLVYDNYERLNSRNYILHLPAKSDKLLGGHCNVLDGHNDNTHRYHNWNQWGPDWGKGGTCEIDDAVIHSKKITSDCWVIEIVEAPKAKKTASTDRASMVALSSLFR